MAPHRLSLIVVVATASATFLAQRAPLPHRARGVSLSLLADAPNADALLGQVSSVTKDGLIAILPENRELAKVGVLLRFGGGSLGVIISERCGLYFAGTIEGTPPAKDESATLLPRNLTVAPWDGRPASWGGLHDFLGRRVGESAAPMPTAPDADDGRPDVFGPPVSAAQRRPIGASLHTGVVAIDALAPIGRGQSMMLFGPDSLPAGAGRTDVALRAVRAQHELQSGVRSVVVLCEPNAAMREEALATMRDQGMLESVRVFEATNAIEAAIAASAACSLAEASVGSDDALVVVDSLRPHLQLWRAICKALKDAQVGAAPEDPNRVALPDSPP